MPREDAPSGLRAVFVAQRPTLLRFLRARGAGEGAEDLLQELWLRLLREPAGPVAQPAAYLFRAAERLLLDQRRAEARAGRREGEWHAAADEPVDLPDGERTLLARERLAAAQATLDALGERTAAIFRRFRIDGISQRVIAGEFGISISAVEKHLGRAYRALLALEKGEADAE